MSEALAVLAAFGYATSDVTTAAIVRRVGAAAIAFWAHVVASAVLLAAAGVAAGPPPLATAALAVGAGLVAGVGAVAYYAALGRGPASVLAPIAAGGVLLPVLAGVIAGDRAALLAVAGTLVLVGGVTLLGRASDESGVATPTAALLLAFGSAFAFGGYFVAVDVAAGTDAAHPLWVAGLVTVGSALAALPVMVRQTRASAGDGRHGRLPGREAVRGLVAIGLALSVADLALTAAMAGSDVALVAVIASADPVLTVMAARVVLAERISRGQVAGIVLTLTGVLAVAAA